MSKFVIKVDHVPANYTEHKISGEGLAQIYTDLGIEIPFPRSDNWYYYTDREGWAVLVSHLLFKSSLYVPEKFDCEDYALRAMLTCAELFGLNTCRYIYGDSPWGRHGYNSLFYGDGFLLLEPNAGFQGQLDSPMFEWKENGYIPISAFI